MALKKVLICLVLLALILAVPNYAYTQDDATIHLAQTLYTLAQNESYDTMLALGTVVMNRVQSVWYPDTIDEVLDQQQQFACGTRYDERALSAAREVLAGRRTLPETVVEYEKTVRCGKLYQVIGGYSFSYMRG